ncbi:MAG: type IV pilus biogenesis protein PilM [Plesiomonas sp.]|uniref:type IV pilus biogenesis protein PilM n=1 Tax=Plesiomonas sp. TaxID=2486279 RepID=UPI003F40FCDD
MFARSVSVGLDIASDAVRVVWCRSRRQGWELLGWHSIVLPTGTFQGDRLVQPELLSNVLLQVHKIVPRRRARLCIALPGAAVMQKTLMVDAFLTEQERLFRVEAELPALFPLPPHELAFDFCVEGVPTTNGRIKLVVTAARRELMHEYLSILTQSGLTADVVDITPLALRRAMSLARNALPAGIEFEQQLLVHLSPRSILVSSVPDSPLFFRDQPLSIPQQDDTTPFLPENLLQEQWLNEVTRQINLIRQMYHSTGRQSNGLLVSGRINESDARLLSTQLSIPVQGWSPFMGLSLIVGTPQLEDVWPFTLACGLAVWEANE